MPRHAILGAILLACTMTPSAWAADAAILPGESRTTAARLAEVRKKIDDKKFTEAIDELLAILDTAGTDLVPLTPQHSVQARPLCHRELSKLPPEALREYRSRVDVQAKKWLDEAIPTRDVRLLRRVVDEAFCSRPGETAVDLLGDLAFERGHFTEALGWWSRLAPPLGKKRDDTRLVYPDVQGDRARLYAKQLVAQHFAGDVEETTGELKAFQKEYPDAEGTFAGRKGKYVDLLQMLLKEMPPDGERMWTTFGGDATRGLVLPASPNWLDRLDRTVKDGPTWRFNLESRLRQDDPAPPPEKVVPPSEFARSYAFHPLICGDRVFVSDARFVTACDLRTGKVTDLFDVAELNALATPNLKLPAKEDLRYTLTAAGDCLYVRLGAQELFRPDEIDRNEVDRAKKEAERDRKIASFLACLSLDPAAKENRVRWCTRPLVMPGKPVLAQRSAMFEGTPLVHNGYLYIAVTWFEGDRTLTAIQCYPAGTDNTPQLRWEQVVCETRELKPKEYRPRHHLLTLAGPNLVYCSHSGAIVAVDAQTGKTMWGVRYPSKTPTAADDPSLRDLQPCVYAAGRLYAAPSDHDRLLCLDPQTGGTEWERERIDATHLLGVGKGKLIFTTLTGLRAVNAANGGDEWVLPDGGARLTPWGRGFLIGDVIVWPTSNGVFVLYQEDGTPSYNPVLNARVPAGNLVYNNGVLVVADRTTLSVFVPQETPSKEPRKETMAPSARGLRFTSAPLREISPPLTFPLERTATLALEDGERTLFVGNEQLLTTRDGTLRLRSAATGETRWTSKLSFAATWAEPAEGQILTGGTHGIAALRETDGERLWQVRAGNEPLSGFRVAGGRLFYLQDNERLFAVEAATGKPLWSQWAIGAKLKLTPPHGRFHPHFLATTTTLLVQPTPGRLWLLDAATGKRLHEQSQRFEPWPRPPVALDEGTACVVLDSRTVVLLDLLKGKTLWKHTISDATTPTGEAPHLLIDRTNILLLTPNNLGWRLQKLDGSTGESRWPRPPLLEAKTPLDPAGWSMDEQAVYCLHDQVLTARSLVDGAIQWRQALAGGGGNWRTQRVGDALLAYPGDPAPRRFQFRWLWLSVQWEIDQLRGGGAERGLSVMCCDAKSGRTMQRLNLVAGPPRVRTRLGFLSRFAPQPRLEASLDAPRLHVARNDLTLAFGAHVWRFAPTR